MTVKTIYGVVNPSGGIVSGGGYKATRIDNGEYQIQFDSPFSNTPAVVGSQVLFNSENQDPRDNITFPFLNTNGFTAITGDSGGSHKDRNFAFIATGE